MLQGFAATLAILIGLSQPAPSLPEVPVPPAQSEIEEVSYLQGETLELPIIMYHSVSATANPSNGYEISNHQFEADLDYFQSEGYNTILMEELIDYVHNDGRLPENPILLTLDDGYRNNYEEVFPLLAQYKSKAVICPITSGIAFPIDDYRLPFISLEQALELDASPWVELQSHTYDMHNSNGRSGCLRLPGESYATYRQIFQEDLRLNTEYFQEHGLTLPTTFSYPGGYHNTETHNLLVEAGFLASYTTFEPGMNKIVPGNKNCLYNLSRYNREPGLSSQEFFKKLK